MLFNATFNNKQYIRLVSLWCLTQFSTISNILDLPYTEITNEVYAYLTLTTTPYKMKNTIRHETYM